MNNLVIYNEAEINSMEVRMLPTSFKIEVKMHTSNNGIVRFMDIGGEQELACVCIEATPIEFPEAQFTEKECLHIGREVARHIAADIASFVEHGTVPYECIGECPTFDLFKFTDKWENDLTFGIRKVYYARRAGNPKQ